MNEYKEPEYNLSYEWFVNQMQRALFCGKMIQAGKRDEETARLTIRQICEDYLFRSKEDAKLDDADYFPSDTMLVRHGRGSSD